MEDPKVEIEIKVNGVPVTVTHFEFRSFWFQVDFNHKDFPCLDKISGYNTNYPQK